MKPAADDGLKISVQYRTKRGKVYELTRGNDVLALHISPPANGSENWHVEAKLGATAGPAVIDGWGVTATAALYAAALVWTSRNPLLTVFDWDAVTKQLRDINAV